MKLSELYWHRITPLHLILWPLSFLFNLFIKLRKLCYWLDILPSVRLPVPVIVIDSMTTEDGGKTPLILWIVDFLRTRGLNPGIITRGNSDNPGLPHAVTVNSDPMLIGSKTLLLAQRCGDICPIWAGDDRITVANALLTAHPDCNIILCNDGLQDPRLERDMEIAVVDFSGHSFGNGLVLPAGPVREDLTRLEDVDIVVINGKQKRSVNDHGWARTFNMKLISEMVYNVLNPAIRHPASILRDKRLHAIADFNNTHWLFDQLQQTGLNAVLHSFSENHRFIQPDIHHPDADGILMPEENAIQCRSFAPDTLWALPVDAWINNELQTVIWKKIGDKFKDAK